MSYGARLTLLKACLASIPVYLMSIIKFPKCAIEAINSKMARLFWMTPKRSIGFTYPISSPYGLKKITGA
jgi:hypothetical protein